MALIATLFEARVLSEEQFASLECRVWDLAKHESEMHFAYLGMLVCSNYITLRRVQDALSSDCKLPGYVRYCFSDYIQKTDH